MKNILIVTLLLISIFNLNATEMILDISTNKNKDIYYDFTFDVLQNSLKEHFQISSKIDTKKFILQQKRYKDFFVASRKFQDENKFTGDILKITYHETKGEAFKLNIDFFSGTEKKQLLKKKFILKPQNLIEDLNKVLDDISGVSGKLIKFKNSTGIEDSRILKSYLKALFYKNQKEIYLCLEELEFLQNWFKTYPFLEKMYNEEVKLVKEQFKNTKTPFKYSCFEVQDNNQDFLVKENNNNHIETFFREVMVNGYRINYIDEIITPLDEDSVEFNVKVVYEIKLTKLYQALLNKKLKKNKVQNKFSSFGRYKFSNDEEENNKFIDLLKKQSLVLELFDSQNEVVATSEYFVKEGDFDSGRYRHSKNLPFPLTPQGSASSTFKIALKSIAYFIIDNLDKEDLDKVKYSKIKFKFQDF